MGRWRPPRPKASPYITPAGFKQLQEELDGLWLRRRDVVAALSAAAAEGDRSENAEYIYRKKELGGIDYRIRYLQKRLPDLTIVRSTPNTDRIFFGATIKLVNEEDEEMTIRIVGPDEADSKRSAVSLDSPLAQALLKKQVDDEAEVTVEGETVRWQVLEISYR
ncbi:MAG: GreA/GreB family elongation factor [Woeseiaceae bacterium]